MNRNKIFLISIIGLTLYLLNIAEQLPCLNIQAFSDYIAYIQNDLNTINYFDNTRAKFLNLILSTDNLSVNISSIASSSLFLFGKNIKLPDWLKWLFSYILIIALIFKILGISSILVLFTDLLSLKYFIYVYVSLVILYLLFNIYLLNHFYKNKDINIEKYNYLPDFIVSWLNNFKILTSRKELYDDMIKSEFKELYLYISILIFIFLIS